MALIDHIDPETRRIYLSVDTMNTAWHPVDLYREVRALRQTNEVLRQYDNFMKGDGNIDKGGGKATERYFTLLQGTRIIPWNASHIIDITGTLITDDGFEGAFCFDKTSLSAGVSVDIQYAPKQVEVINLNFDDLVYSSFQNGVWIDVNSTWVDAGSETYPNGNRERPVNNTQLATEIAIDRGFSTLYILGNLTLDTGDNVDGFTLIGQNPVRTYLTVMPAASTISCEIKEVTLIGVLDGNSTIRDSVIGPVTYVNGSIVHCVLTEYGVTLGGNAEAILIDCSSGVPGTDTPILNMNGSGQALALRGYVGGIRITNKTGDDRCSIDVDSGHVIMDASVVSPNFPVVVRGNAKFTNEATDADVDISGLTNPTNTADYVWERSTRELTTAAVSGDVNIVSVQGVPVTSVDDFKADIGILDTSGIAQEVWEYATRTITTTVFDTNIITVNGVVVNSIDDFKADVSNLSADVNVVEVNGVVVNSIDDFKAAEFDGDVNITSVQGTPVISVDDFKADVTGLDIDLSDIPRAVWEYVTRELTVAAGLTPEQEQRLYEVPTALENATQVWSTELPLIPDPVLYPQGV